MKCAIELILDVESQNKINNVRNILQANGVHDEAVKLNHISLADVEIDENQIDLLKDIASSFAKSHKKQKLMLAVAGSFMTNENVLFFAPIMTQSLVDYNDELICDLTRNKISCGKYYTKDNWFPHCTLAIKLNNDELKKSFEILKDNNILPLTVAADSIDILCYEPKPYNQICIYELQ